MNYALITSVLAGFLLVLHIFKKNGRHKTIVAVLIGFGIAPVVKSWISTVLNMVGGMAFGLSISVVAAIAVCAWLYYDVKERRNHKMTMWIGLIAASVIFSAQGQLVMLANVTDAGNKIMDQGNSQLSGTGR